jgi:hypothetical protein
VSLGSQPKEGRRSNSCEHFLKEYTIKKLNNACMAESENQKQKGDGTDFVKLQSDLDNAKNERKKDGSNNNRNENSVRKTDVSQKKTGGDKQVSPGT